ncbi:MAG: N-acetyltransferase [Spirosomataceae bacterium]
MRNIQWLKFSEINLKDPFFNSLKEDYNEFENWFIKKSQEEAKAFILSSEKGLEAFLFLKSEEGEINDVIPPLPASKRLKIGTFKVNPHGTRLGERFIKKIFDYGIKYNFKEAYVTVFPKHSILIDLLQKYGFVHRGVKKTANGEELVLVKDFKTFNNDLLLDYPRFQSTGVNKYLLAIYPDFHTRLFPDSILNSESFDVVNDVSHTNSIHKVYVCFMDVSQLRRGDIIVIYRTKDDKGPAHYRSVVTSICVVEEVRTKKDFKSFAEYLSYCQPYSVFSSEELLDWYNNKNIFTIKMMYNAAIQKRLTRGMLIEELKINDKMRWNFFQLKDDQFSKIITYGKVDENLIIY